MESAPQADSKTWKRVGLALGPLTFAAIALIPSGLHRIEGAGHRPAYAAAVAALMAIWWFTEALPISVTACLPLVLYPLFGVFGDGFARDTLQSAEPYVDAYIFLFVGGMVLGAAMEQWRLHRRVALNIMRRIGTDPRRLLLGMLVATATSSLWISNTATAVMMLPIAMALLTQLEAANGGRKLWHFGTAVMLAVAYAANVGGIGTKIGTATNSIFAGYVSGKLQVEISFLKFLAIGLPFVVIFIPIIWWVLWRHARADAMEVNAAPEVISQEITALGRMSKQESLVALVFALAALLWIFGDPIRGVLLKITPVPFLSKHYEAGVSMLAAALLVVLRCVSWAALKRVPWSTLLLLGGSFAMAAGIEASGLSTWLGLKLHAVTQLPLFAQYAITTTSTIGLSAVASNTATVNLMLNVLPKSLPLLAACCIASSCDFALPAGTPPNAIVFGSGYIRLRTMMKIGIVLNLAAALVISIYAVVYLTWLLG